MVGLTSTLMQQALRIAEKEFGARPDASWRRADKGPSVTFSAYEQLTRAW